MFARPDNQRRESIQLRRVAYIIIRMQRFAIRAGYSGVHTGTRASLAISRTFILRS
jgi:hypothetical protein